MRKLLIVSMIVNVMFICFYIGKRIYYTCGFNKPSRQEYAILSEQKNREYTARFATYTIRPSDIVFVGNSLTEAFPVTEYFENVKNRGIGGNRLFQLIGRISQITNGHPKKIFLEIGINDINSEMPLDSIETQYSYLVCLIRQQSPGTQLYIQSLLPTCQDFAEKNDEVVIVNKYLEQMSPQVGATFINIHSKLLLNGKLNEAYSFDGLHLNSQGYEIWRKEIEKYVNN